MDDPRQAVADLLRFIPPDAGLVVEAGSGSGELGEQYLRRNPFCRYARLAVDPAALVSPEEKNIDCLVYREGLEHLPDPWAVLRDHVRQLKDSGQVIACIPNVQHWSSLVPLLRGRWHYPDAGAPARHLRFFTLEGIRSLFTQAGLTIYDIRTRDIAPENVADFQALFGPVAENLGIGRQEFFRQTTAFQYIVRAVKGPAPGRLLIQSLLGETKVCARTRILEPDQFLGTIPGVRTLSEVASAHLQEAGGAADKVFIWQRVQVGEVSRQQELLRRGYLIVAEMDDDPLRWPEHRQNDFFTFRSCHAVQVSTEALAQFMRQLNPNVAVFPNQLAVLPPPRPRDEAEAVTVFFGALNREPDWAPVMPELNRLLQRCSERLRLTVVHDRAFFDALETRNKKFIPFCSYEEYTAALRQSDIALLPLLPGHFNEMKSDLKFLECAGHGVAALASPTVYAATVRDGETGLIYNTPQEFGQKLALLIEDRPFRRKLTDAAYAWVGGNRLLCRHYKQRYFWYRDLLSRLPDLNRELEQRLPGILPRL